MSVSKSGRRRADDNVRRPLQFLEPVLVNIDPGDRLGVDIIDPRECAAFDQGLDSWRVEIRHALIRGADTIEHYLQKVRPLVATRRNEHVSDLDGRNSGDFAQSGEIGFRSVSSWSGRCKTRRIAGR
jgi:hypothetical protein